ncbi:hypothetical protein HDU76_005479, partial [Blyttiomyces sp. JEL0837]
MTPSSTSISASLGLLLMGYQPSSSLSSIQTLSSRQIAALSTLSSSRQGQQFHTICPQCMRSLTTSSSSAKRSLSAWSTLIQPTINGSITLPSVLKRIGEPAPFPLLHQQQRGYLKKADKLKLLKTGTVRPKFERGLAVSETDEIEEEAESLTPTTKETKADSLLKQESVESEHPDNHVPTHDKKPPMVMPELARRGKPKVEWFSDSHLLSRRVHALMEKGKDDPEFIEYAVDLVQRHKAVSNEGVYGALIGGFARLGDHARALEFYKEMRQKKLNPSPQTYTSIMHALSTAASQKSQDPRALNARLRHAMLTWESIDPSIRTTAHANAVLKTCVITARVGGYQAGMEVYEYMLSRVREAEAECEKKKAKGKRSATTMSRGKKPNSDSDIYDDDEDGIYLRPDIVTYTNLLRLCAECGTEESFKTGLRIWERELANASGKRLFADEKVVYAALTLFVSAARLGMMNEAVKGCFIASKAFGLPAPVPRSPVSSSSSHGKETVPTNASFDSYVVPVKFHDADDGTSYPLQLSVVHLDVLLKLAVEMKNRDIGLVYLKAAEERGVQIDEGVAAGAVHLLISGRKYEEAWQIIEKFKQRISEVERLKAANEAEIEKKRALEVNEHDVDLEDEEVDTEIMNGKKKEGVRKTMSKEDERKAFIVELQLRVCSAATSAKLVQRESKNLRWRPAGLSKAEFKQWVERGGDVFREMEASLVEFNKQHSFDDEEALRGRYFGMLMKVKNVINLFTTIWKG